MKYGFTVISTHGYQRLKGVTIAPVSRDGKPDFSRKEYIPCDTLLVAAGLIPELEICGEYDPSAEDGLFLCGNVSKVHDLADHVTAEGVKVGVEAVEYLLGETEDLPPEFASLLSEDLNLQEKEKRGNMICTVCPKSCVMKVENNPFSVKGNGCPRGEAFARQELENPQRVLTAVVSAVGGDCPLLSVRTSRPVSKDSLWTVMKAVRKVRAAAPVTVGDTVAENIAGLGVDLIATDDL